MTTQTTKPERVEVGQRWNMGCGVRTVTSVVGDRANLDNGGYELASWLLSKDYWTYLGPTEPGGGDAAPPSPAVGQRWRSEWHNGTFVITEVVGDRIKMLWPNGVRMNRERREDSADVSILSSAGFHFVDHVETQQPAAAEPRGVGWQASNDGVNWIHLDEACDIGHCPHQLHRYTTDWIKPTVPPKTAPSVPVKRCHCGKPAGFGWRYENCERHAADYERETSALMAHSPPEPRAAALQPLSTFTLPGDVAEQTTAYFTRTRAR